MYFTVTIDVEEDNWSNYDSKPILSNIEKLLNLQKLFDKYDVKPTYLVTYPVATDKESISMLRKIMEDGRCEIGTHVHPWNTPPFEEDKSFGNTMLCNLEKKLQYKKIEFLHKEIHKNFAVEPITFRSGRWGFNHSVAENLYCLGYKVDTSVSPYINWEIDCGPDFSDYSPMVHRISVDNNENPDSYILEVPATIGFFQANFDMCNAILKKISSTKLKHFRMIGILDKLGIINKIWLSPETSDGEQMINLVKTIEKKEYNLINMFFHSSSLKAGLTPFTKSIEDEKIILWRIEGLLKYLASNNVKSITLGESYNIFSKIKTR